MTSEITLTLLLYLVITVRIFTFESPKKPSQSQKIQLQFLLIGVLSTHALLLYPAIFSPQGLNLGFFNMLSLIAWLVIFLLSLNFLQKPVQSLLVVFAPLAFILVLLAAFLPSNHLMDNLKSGVKMHIVTSIIAYSIFVLAALQAIFMAIQEHKLRQKQAGWVIQHFPALTTMETFLFQLLQAGFLFLTLGLVSGGLYLDNIFAQHLAHKTILSIFAWFMFAYLLIGHWRYGWRGRVAIRWTIIGFSCLMLSKSFYFAIINNRYS